MKWIVLLAAVALTVAMRDQSIAVRGRLLCGSKPASNVRVKLWEEDSGPDPDDLLDQGYTDGNGEFMLQGGTAELTPIDPIFKVYHDCDDGIKPGSRKVKFALPKSYITNGKTPKKTFDIGILNLETIFAKEEREMIVSRRRRGGINADYMDPDRSSERSEVVSRNRRGGINEEYMDPDRAKSTEDETDN
uniref:Transthyretin domain containing protein n=1 Tax=Haemonchus contortus TaxID=6289 RepID=A0A7I4YTW1_HAECO